MDKSFTRHRLRASRYKSHIHAMERPVPIVPASPRPATSKSHSSNTGPESQLDIGPEPFENGILLKKIEHIVHNCLPCRYKWMDGSCRGRCDWFCRLTPAPS